MAVYKRPGSKHWYVRFSWRGKRIDESTRCTNRRLAQKIEAAIRARLARGEARTPVTTFPLPEDLCLRP